MLIPSLSPGSFVVRFGEAGLRRIAVRFDSAKPAALFVIRRSIRDSGLAEYVALLAIIIPFLTARPGFRSTYSLWSCKAYAKVLHCGGR
jgi:hypothetical protein